jgi:hypothetical protein
VVLGGVDGTKDRKRWVVWHEGGRYPDVIIEITSPSTKSKDTKDNLLLYSKVFRDAGSIIGMMRRSGELVGYRLQGDEYAPIAPNENGWLWSEVLGGVVGSVGRAVFGLAVSVVAVIMMRGWQFSADGRGSGACARRTPNANAPSKPSNAPSRNACGANRSGSALKPNASYASRNACCASKPSNAPSRERLLREQAEQRLAELEAELKRLRGEQ